MATDDPSAAWDAGRESELCEAALRSGVDGVAVLGPNSGFLYVNDACCEISGYTRGELLRMGVGDLVVGASPGSGAPDPGRLLEAEAARRELRWRRKDGSEVDVEVRTGASTGGDVLFSFVRDVTGRRRAEEKARSRQEHRTALLRLAHGLATARTNEEVLDAATVEIRAVLGTKETWLYLFSEDREHASAIAARGSVTEPVLRGESVRLAIRGHALLEEIASSTELVCVEDALTDPRTDKARVTRQGLRTLVNVPLLFLDRRLGAIGTGTTDTDGTRKLAPEECDFLGALASQVAVALDRVRIDGERQAALEASRRSEAELALHRNHLAELVEERSAALLLANAELVKEVEARSRAEEEFRQQAEFLSLVLRSADAGTWLWDVEADRHEWSPELRRLIGVPADAVASAETWSAAVHPDDRERDVDELHAAMEPGALLDHEFRVVHPTGAVRWIRTVGSADCGADGRPRRFAGFALDTTRRKEAEERLRRAEERWQFALEGSGDGVWDWYPLTGEVFYSRKWKEMLGYADDEVACRVDEWESRIHPDDRSTVSEAVSRYFDGRDTEYAFEHRLRSRDGTYRWILSRGLALRRGPDGRPTRMIGTHTDVTKRRAAEEELRAARDAAEAANRAKSAFLASMSHEIRTPMNSILGFSQLLLGGSGLSARQREQLQAIQRGGEHLLGLINDVLEMSKIEAGRATVDLAETDLHGLVLDLEEMFRLRARQKGLTLDVVRAGDLPRLVVTDEMKLRQIVINLAGNAVKFTQKGGVKVRVHAVPGEGERAHLNVDVEDTGPGIGEEELSRLFQRFEQARAGREAGGGTGLGLTISQAFAQMMGGGITVRSRPGEGSAFCLSLPVTVVVSSLAVPRAGARRVSGLPPEETRRRILVADDVAENREILRQMLERVGFQVATASDGAEALESLASWQPNLVLMDLRMPGMDGLEAIRTIRATEDAARVPLVAVTASAFDEDRRAVAAAGGDAFVSKPFREADLLETVGRCLGIRYDYEGEAASPAGPPATRAPAVPVPEPLRAALLAAVERADLDAILRIADEVAAIATESARTVRELAEAFEYERLAEYLSAAS